MMSSFLMNIKWLIIYLLERYCYNLSREEKMSKFDVMKRINELRDDYKRYKGESKDKKRSLADICEYFHIPIDKERIEDYRIVSIELDEAPSILIMDEATMTIYKSAFTSRASEFGLNKENYERFIVVSKICDDYRMDQLYPSVSTTSKKSLVRKMIIEKDGHNLELIDGFSTSFGMLSMTEETRVVYSKGDSVSNGNGRDKKILLERKLNKYADTSMSELECFRNCAPFFLGDIDDKLDCYVYRGVSGVFYGLNNKMIVAKGDPKGAVISGFCSDNVRYFENSSMPVPSAISNWSGSNPRKRVGIASAMCFKGVAGTIYYKIEVIKKVGRICVSIDTKREEAYAPIQREEYALDVLAPNRISLEEIDEIVSSLRSRHGDDVFIDMVVKEIFKFRREVAINRGLMVRQEDVLSPRNISGLDVDALEKAVIEKGDIYFEEAERLYESSLDLLHEEEVKSFRMRPIE